MQGLWVRPGATKNTVDQNTQDRAFPKPMFYFYKGSLCVAQSTLDRGGMGQNPYIREPRVQGAETIQAHCEEAGNNSSTLPATSSALSESPSLSLKIVIVREDRDGSGSQKCLKVGKGLCKVVNPLI